MEQVGPSREKINTNFIHLCTSALPLKQCKTSKKSIFLIIYFINIIFLPNSMYSKWYMQDLGEKKVNPHFIRVLLHSRLNNAKLVKNLFLFNYIFYKHYFISMFDVFEMKRVGHSREKKFKSHFTHMCTSALPLNIAKLV